LLLYSLDVSRTSYGFPNLERISPVIKPIVSFVKWNVLKPMNRSQAVLVRNFGFIIIEDTPLPSMLKAVMIFYL